MAKSFVKQHRRGSGVVRSHQRSKTGGVKPKGAVEKLKELSDLERQEIDWLRENSPYRKAVEKGGEDFLKAFPNIDTLVPGYTDYKERYGQESKPQKDRRLKDEAKYAADVVRFKKAEAKGAPRKDLPTMIAEPTDVGAKIRTKANMPALSGDDETLKMPIRKDRLKEGF